MRKFRNLVVKKLAQGQIVGKNMLGIDPELLILNDQALLLKRSYILKNIAFFFLILVLTHAACRNVTKHIQMNNNNKNKQDSEFFFCLYPHRYSYQFTSVDQLCPILCNPMDWSMPSFRVHHQFPELTQTNVHRVSDAIQPSHPLSSSSPPTFNLSHHQGLFK